MMISAAQATVIAHLMLPAVLLSSARLLEMLLAATAHAPGLEPAIPAHHPRAVEAHREVTAAIMFR